MASATPRSPDDDPTGEFPVLSPRIEATCAGLTHPGRVRENNEDHFLIARLAKSMRIEASSLTPESQTLFSGESGLLLTVADGMGGAAAGEQASALAVEAVEGFVLNVFKWFLHLDRSEESVLFAELRECLDRADDRVVDRARSDRRLAGMGTTLTLAYSVGQDLYLVHAGDSRAYLLRDGQLDQLTTDHTLVQLLVDGGQITPEAARHHRGRNVVTNVVGGPRPGVHAEIHKLQVEHGDVLLLCTDGLSQPVDAVAIAGALAGTEPDAACRRLVDLALEAGAPDNVSVVVARFASTVP